MSTSWHKVVGLLSVSLLPGCADRATIGALCPPGCEPRIAQSVCDCPAPRNEPADAGACTGVGCDAAVSASTDGAALPGEADGCSAPALVRRRLDLMVVVDDAASLAPWYGAMSEGFRAFLQEPGTRGVGVGLLRFGESCSAADYLPPVVPIATLPENLAALEAALPAAAFSTNSTLPALAAAEQHAQRWATDHPEAQVTVLLLTDASPGACDSLTGNYDVEAPRLAGAAKLSRPSIDTYVVAVGSLEVVSSIARSGGTELQRLPITATSDDMLAALRAVRDVARSCELVLPSGTLLGADSQVIVTGASGAEVFDIGADSSDCDQAAFYRAGTSLVACPQACTRLDGAQQIELSGTCASSP